MDMEEEEIEALRFKGISQSHSYNYEVKPYSSLYKKQWCQYINLYNTRYEQGTLIFWETSILECFSIVGSNSYNSNYYVYNNQCFECIETFHVD